MNLLRRSNPEPDPSSTVDVGTTTAAGNAGKGRPTPKRREAAPKRQPMSAPRTTKEANQQRKQQNAQAPRRGAGISSTTKAMSTREFREAMRRGDESALPKRDKGPVRRLARDWVDTHVMASNFLLLAFPLLLFAGNIPNRLGTYVTVAVFVLFALEWVWTGRRIHALAVSRFDTVPDKAWVLGLYAAQRAFMLRKWRVPQPTLRRGDPI